MPIKQAAKKALRQTITRTSRNLDVKKKLEFLERNIKKAFAKNNLEEVKKVYKELQQVVDKAAKNKVFHKSKVDRMKSRLMKKINALKK
ncbi:MAG: 30S ribosomal protein S20 [Patescibacteria group bacterium]|jgi:ribosomal protein S20